jgi:hypothetical protein
MTKKDKPVFTASEQELIEDLLRQKLRRYRPRVQFKEELYHRLAHDHLMDKRWVFKLSHYFHIFKRVSVSGALLVFISVFSLTTSYAYFSPTVTPESPLFSLKKSVEGVDLALSSSPESKVEKLVKFTERRKVERKYLRKIGVNKSQKTDHEIHTNLAEAAQLLAEIDSTSLNTMVADSVEKEGLVEEFATYAELGFPVLATEPTDPNDTVAGSASGSGIDIDPDDIPNVTIPATLPAVVVPTINPLDYEQEFDDDSGDYGMGGAYDTADSYAESAPSAAPSYEMAPAKAYSAPTVSCSSECSPGVTYQCGIGGFQGCRDLNGDGCYEFDKCVEPELPLGVNLDDYEWEL